MISTPAFKALLLGALVVNAALWAFVSGNLLTTLRIRGPMWEAIALATVDATLAFGIFFALYVYFRVSTASDTTAASPS